MEKYIIVHLILRLNHQFELERKTSELNLKKNFLNFELNLIKITKI